MKTMHRFLFSFIVFTAIEPLKVYAEGSGAVAVATLNTRTVLKEDAPAESRGNGQGDMQLYTAWSPADSQARQLEQFKEISSKHVANGGEPPTRVIITFNSQSEQATTEASTLADALPEGVAATLIAVDQDTPDRLADVAVADVAQVPSRKSLRERLGIPRVDTPTTLERSTAWFLASVRATMLIPVLAVGVSAPLSPSAAAGYVLFVVMSGRTWWRAHYLQFFDKLYTGYSDVTKQRRFSKNVETVLRYSADLYFMTVITGLTSVNRNIPFDAAQMMVLWGVQTYLDNVFQTARAGVYKNTNVSPDQATLNLQRSVFSNLNFWLLCAPWGMLDLFGLTPKLLHVVSADLTLGHLALAVTSVATVMSLKTKWYNGFLDMERRLISDAVQVGYRSLKVLRNANQKVCNVLKSAFIPAKIEVDQEHRMVTVDQR